MAFLAALPAIASVVSAGAGVAGAMGAFGGQQKNTSTQNTYPGTAGATLGIGDYLRGNQLLSQYQDILNQVNSNWGNNTELLNLMRGTATNSVGPVAQAQANAITSDINTYQPLKDASVQTGLAGQNYLRDQYAQGQKTFDLASTDENQALNQSMNLYRPLETQNMTRLGEAGGTAWEAAKDYYNTMKTGVSPEQWASQAGADTLHNYDQQLSGLNRQQAALGLDPSSGAARNQDIEFAANMALNKAGASTQARQQAIAQNRTDLGKGVAALNAGEGVLSNVQGAIKAGPMSAGLPILQQSQAFSPTSYQSTILPMASSLSGNSALNSWAPTPVAPNYSQVGDMANTAQGRLYSVMNSIGGMSSNQTQTGNNSSGYGAMLGQGLYGLNSTNLGALGNLFGNGSLSTNDNAAFANNYMNMPMLPQ